MVSVALLIFAFYKISLGLHSDEAHFIAVGDMISRGNIMFKQIWYYQQLSGVFVAPVIWIFEKLTGGRESVLLVFRILSVIIQTLICTYFYNTFKDRFNKKYVACACIILFTYIPDFQSFNYKQAIIWFVTLMIIYSYRYYLTGDKRYAILLGLSVSACVLEYPTAILLAITYTLILLFIDRKNERKPVSIIYFILTCMICAGVFFAYIFSNLSIREFIFFFPKVFKDDNLDTRFIFKLIHPLIKFAVMGLAYMLCVQVATRIKVLKKLPVVSTILIVAFVGQCIVERRGITWHCITYPYMMTMFMIPTVFSLSYYLKRKDAIDTDLKCIAKLFMYPACTAILAMMVASNQSNITGMYPAVFGAVALVMIISEAGFDSDGIMKEKAAISTVLIVCAIVMYILPVWEQEACMDYGTRTVFSERIMVNDGCLAGIKVGKDYYEKYYRLYRVEENIKAEDITLIIDDYDISALGYLNLKGRPSTFSPQGGLGIDSGEKIMDYLTCNPELQPTKIILNMNYINDSLDNYMKKTPLGEYISNNHYSVLDYTNGYIVLMRDVH